MNDFNTRFSEVLAPVIPYDTDIPVAGSEGSWVVDIDGNRYLDFTSGIAVSNLGHQPPHVKAAVLQQLDEVWHAGGAFKYESKVRAAERLRQITPNGIDQFLFMNSGAEAVEAAVKLARKTSGRQGIIVFRGGFHGRTMGSVTYTTSKSRYRTGYHPLVPSVFVAPFPHPYRWGMSQEDANAYALEELRLLFKHEITPTEVAGFLVEPMQGEGGYYPGSVEFLRALRTLADEHGILLIADEVQTGFGRTGDWFTSQVYNVRPDILVMGKAIANGLPLSAVGAGRDLFGRWPPGSHGTTFGGNPVSCAASAATIEALGDVLPQVDKLSEHAFERLDDMAQRYQRIGDVRGMGLMIGVELADADRTPRPDWLGEIRREALDRGLLLLTCGPDENVMRFLPPLNASIAELDQGIDIIDQSFAATESS